MPNNEELAALVRAGRTEYTLPLWQGVQRFVYQQATRWSRAWGYRAEVDDLAQCGFLALLDAVEDYDPAKGKFLTWYTLFLQKAFSEAVGCRTEGQRREPLNTALSLEAPVGEDTDTVTLGDTLEGPDPIADADRRLYLEQLHNALEAELEGLPPEQRDVLRHRFYGEQTRREVCEALALTMDGVRRREEHGLNALRRPRAARRLRLFLDDRTDFYGLHGVHAVEDAVTWREQLEEERHCVK